MTHKFVDNHPRDSCCGRPGGLLGIKMVFWSNGQKFTVSIARQTSIWRQCLDQSGHQPKVDLTLRKVFVSCSIDPSIVNITDIEVRISHGDRKGKPGDAGRPR